MTKQRRFFLAPDAGWQRPSGIQPLPSKLPLDLDPVTARELAAALDAALAGKTVLAISHQPLGMGFDRVLELPVPYIRTAIPRNP